MVQSGRAEQTAEEKGKGGEIQSSLSEVHLQLLDGTYRKLLASYNHLLCLYEEDLKRATNARRKSLFAQRCDWRPPFDIGVIGSEMLQGPQIAVTIRKRMYCEDEKTGRKFVYTSAAHETATRHRCSFVQIIHSERAGHQYGQIVYLFEHTFLGQTRKFGLLNV